MRRSIELLRNGRPPSLPRKSPWATSPPSASVRLLTARLAVAPAPPAPLVLASRFLPSLNSYRPAPPLPWAAEARRRCPVFQPTDRAGPLDPSPESLRRWSSFAAFAAATAGLARWQFQGEGKLQCHFDLPLRLAQWPSRSHMRPGQHLPTRAMRNRDAAAVSSEGSTASTESTSTRFELVALATPSGLDIYIDEFATYAPVDGASVEIDTPEGPRTARSQPGQPYRLDADFVKKPGDYDLVATIQAGGIVEILPFAIHIAQEGESRVASDRSGAGSQFRNPAAVYPCGAGSRRLRRTCIWLDGVGTQSRHRRRLSYCR